MKGYGKKGMKGSKSKKLGKIKTLFTNRVMSGKK